MMSEKQLVIDELDVRLCMAPLKPRCHGFTWSGVLVPPASSGGEECSQLRAGAGVGEAEGTVEAAAETARWAGVL